MVDTNGDPEIIDYPIPGNDDAIRAIRLYCAKMADAVLEGTGMRKEEVEEEVVMPDIEELPADAIEEKVASEYEEELTE